MAKVIHKTEKKIWVFASNQMGGIKAFVNMLKDDNDPLEEIVEKTVDEAKNILPEGAKIEDIRVETSNLNGPVINVVIKANIG